MPLPPCAGTPPPWPPDPWLELPPEPQPNVMPATIMTVVRRKNDEETVVRIPDLSRTNLR